MNNENEELIVREDQGITTDGFELIFSHETGGKIYRHTLVDTFGKDHGEILEVSIDKASIGCIVHILPILNIDDPLRDIIFKGVKYRKCPDLKIDGRFTEIKTPTGTLHPNKIGNNIRFAHGQANDVIIRLQEEFDVTRLKSIAKGRFAIHTTLNTLEFKMNGVYYCFKRSDFV